MQKIQKLSRIFQPSLIIPKELKNKVMRDEIQSKSSKLMLELGIIKQSSPGCFNLLPLGVRALEKLIRIVDEEMKLVGGQKVEFPSLINQKLWYTSGRINEVNELFKLTDRQGHHYLLGPTHEEIATELLSHSLSSYKQFPLLLYQITSKFRDELKPRLGLIRSKQFCMKDMYSFDIDSESAMETYEAVNEAYCNFFQRIGVDFKKIKGDTGTMGGSVSHEYHFQAEVGEDILITCTKCNNISNAELIKENRCPECDAVNHIEKSKGIEVGHTFFLGDRYSQPFSANYTNKQGKSVNLQMCCFGLGLTRILAGSLEILSSNQELRWPRPIVPYSVLIIPPKAGSKEELVSTGIVESLYHALNKIPQLSGDILVDDRSNLTIGRRQMQGKQFGYPIIIVLGGRIKEEPALYEVHDTEGGVQLDLTFDNLLSYVNSSFIK